MPIDSIHPAAWALGGGVGSVLTMLVVRFLLKQYGEIPVDQKRARAEGAIHDAYRGLIESLRAEISRLHDEVTRMNHALELSEQRHHQRDAKDEARSNEIHELTRQLRERGIVL